QAGWPEGYYILGLMKMQGIGMKVDRRRGRVLLEQAAAAGVVDAKDVLNSREKVNLLEALRRI
ncbi:SEL1-like repeat protein, partial [Allisonella histaminiformans]